MSGLTYEPSFDAASFRSKVQGTLTTLTAILDESRRPLIAEDVHHAYSDKFALADFLANTSLAATFQCLEALGLEEPKLRELHAAAATSTITLRLAAEETCSFERSAKLELDSGQRKVVETGVFGAKESKVVTVLTEHVWRRGVAYELSASLHLREHESPAASTVSLARREAHCEHTTTVSGHEPARRGAPPPPFPAHREVPAAEADVTWLLRQLRDVDGSLQLTFKVDRESAVPAARCELAIS